MEVFWKAAGAVLIAVILSLTIEKTAKDFSALLSITACCLIGMVALSYLDPVLSFLQELGDLSDRYGDILGILLKAAGITLVSELTNMICRDSGQGALGSAFQMLSSAMILCLSIPLFHSFLTMLQEILGG